MTRRRKGLSRRARRGVVTRAPVPFGAPPRRRGRWALLLLVLLALLLYPLGRFLLTPPEAREAAAGLRASAVFVAADGRDVLDAERVRQVVGDRPIVVAVLRRSYRGGALAACEAVARQQPRNLVLAYRAGFPGEYPGICAGRRFPEPETEQAGASQLGGAVAVWLWHLGDVAQKASAFRVSEKTVDRTPEVESLVLAFDEAVRDDYPHGVPRRVASPAPLTLGRVLLQLLGLAGLLLAGFVGLRLLARGVERRADGGRELADRRAALGADLSRVAALLLEGPPTTRAQAEHRAEVAELYLHALTAVERADDAAGLEVAGQAVRRLTAAAR